MAERVFRGNVAAHKITEDLGVLQFEYSLECRTFGNRRARVIQIEVPQEEHVELLHAAPAAPAQARPQSPLLLRRAGADDAQCCRSAIISLISAIALAGFRSLGQASAQFMIV